MFTYKKARFYVLALVFTLLMLALQACGTGGGLYAQWAEEGSDLCEAVVEFKRDGTLTYEVYTSEFSGTFEIVDSNTIEVSMSGLFAPWKDQLMDYSIEGDTLALTIEGKSTRYKRTNVSCQ
jgi:hypothetical protein